MTKDKPNVYVDSMQAPNHMVKFDLGPLDASEAKAHAVKYPLLHIALPDTKGSGQPGRLAFVAKPYNCVHWADRSPHAVPTWMDPELFIRQLKHSKPELFEKARAIALSGDKVQVRKLVPDLTASFDEIYVEFIRRMFEHAAPLIAEWIVAHEATAMKDEQITG